MQYLLNRAVGDADGVRDDALVFLAGTSTATDQP
jgi:hypothetical protein